MKNCGRTFEALGENVNRVKYCEKVTDNSSIVRKVSSEVKVGERPAPVKEGSQTDSTDSSQSGPSEEARGSKLQEEDEALNVCFIGKEANNAGYSDAIESNKHLGERELNGSEHVMEEFNNNE
ncbi:hypothetical protein V6N13_038681 [Hibiscus sabdariffa]